MTICVACQRQSPQAEPFVEAEPGLDEAPFRVEFRAWAFPDKGEGMNHVTYGLNMDRAGGLLVGIGNNYDNGYVYRFDTEEGQFTILGNFRAALESDLFHDGNYGKFHVGPYQDVRGNVWVASHPREGWEAEQAGRLFRISPGLEMEDFGPTPKNQGVYFMTGDDRYDRLYLATRNSHFLVYDLVSGQWRDKGRFTSKAPFIGLFDTLGRLYMYGYDGEGDWSVGPSTISRYDPESDILETSNQAPPTLWVGAVTPDHEQAYTTTYRSGDLYRWRFDEWPAFKAEHLGRIDPAGRAVFSNNLSLAAGGKFLVVAGTIVPESVMLRDHEHGVWVYELSTGRRWQVADLNDVISTSMGIESSRHKVYWTNANTVGNDGWIWIGISSMPFDSNAIARLLGIRISPR